MRPLLQLLRCQVCAFRTAGRKRPAAVEASAGGQAPPALQEAQTAEEAPRAKREKSMPKHRNLRHFGIIEGGETVGERALGQRQCFMLFGEHNHCSRYILASKQCQAQFDTRFPACNKTA